MQNNGYLLNKLINIDEKEIYSDLNLHARPGFRRDEYLSLNGAGCQNYKRQRRQGRI